LEKSGIAYGGLSLRHAGRHFSALFKISKNCPNKITAKFSDTKVIKPALRGLIDYMVGT
jgi:hypothetical protein